MRDNWKLIVTLTITVVVLAFVGWQGKQSFAPQAPTVLNYVQHTSPRLTFNGDLRRAWKNVVALLTLARREEKATGKQLTQLSFVQVSRLPTETLLWDSLEARNPGFETMRRIERSEPGAPAKLIGYYTLTGQPLAYDTKTDLRNPRQALTTVTLDSPLGPGQSVLFFRVLRATNRVTTNTPGKGVVSLGRLSASASAIHATGLALPKPAELEKYTTDGALVTGNDKMHVVTWLSTRSEASNRNLQATFSIPK